VLVFRPCKISIALGAAARVADARRLFLWHDGTDSHRRRILRESESFWMNGTAASDGRRARIVLDEIHKYPRWKRFVKGLFDINRDSLEIIVTGSGRLDIYQKGGASLLGRYNLHRLESPARGSKISLPCTCSS
jgi:predicted AAA+ superfamily ATPase